jgi:hypothetical protein
MGLARGMIWGRSARFYLTWLWSRLTVSASTITKVEVSILQSAAYRRAEPMTMTKEALGGLGWEGPLRAVGCTSLSLHLSPKPTLSQRNSCLQEGKTKS